MSNLLPPPYDFGVDEHYDSWRPHQDEVVEFIVDSDRRYILPVCPTGFGKSLVYVVASSIIGGRVVILTSTRALQDQLLRDFDGLIADLRGKDNYKCNLLGGFATCGKGPCNWGLNCPFKAGGCEYYDHVRHALSMPIISTNYAYWLRRNDWGGTKDHNVQFSTIVCDEAHELPEILSSFLTKEIIMKERESVEGRIVRSFPMDGGTPQKLAWIEQWDQDIGLQFNDLAQMIKQGRYDSQILSDAKRLERLKECTGFIRRGLADDPANLVVYRSGRNSDRIVASVVWPYNFTESHFLKGIEKVVATSATVTEKTMGLLGIDMEEVDKKEVDHPFPLENRLLYHVPTIRLNYRSPPIDIRTWLSRIDQILGPRRDRKSIVHSVSYKRQRQIIDSSKHADIMWGHKNHETLKRVEAFKKYDRPAILVSPVMTTGYDFPDDECRCQIIGKIAYPDVSDPIIKKRMEMDKDYAPYIAMQRLVQTCGRGVRNLTDWCENFIIDDNVRWFASKYKKFAPKWFRESMRTCGKNKIPGPRELQN